MKKTLFLRTALSVAVSLSLLFLICTPAYAAKNITEAQAKKIALKDAGLKEKEVILLKVELTDGSENSETAKETADEGASQDVPETAAEDGSDAVTIEEPRYVIEFYHNGTLYEYAIDYASGDILSTVLDTEFFLNPGALPSSMP
jgi:hypothetical protein